jgi:uncharacterized membrane protein
MQVISVVVGRGSCRLRGRGGKGFNIGVCMAGVVVAIAVAMSVSIAVIVLVKEHSTDDVQGKANASDYKNQLRVIDMLKKDEALDRLEEDAHA